MQSKSKDASQQNPDQSPGTDLPGHHADEVPAPELATYADDYVTTRFVEPSSRRSDWPPRLLSITPQLLREWLRKDDAMGRGRFCSPAQRQRYELELARASPEEIYGIKGRKVVKEQTKREKTKEKLEKWNANSQKADSAAK